MTYGNQTAHAAPDAPFSIVTPAGPPGPLVAASPHSGRIYPAELIAASRLDPLTLRRSEDAYVDELIAGAPALGIALLAARYARAYLDVNREPYELDPSMFADALPAHVRRTSERLAAGLGTVPRVVGLGLDIYDGKLRFDAVEARIQTVYRPYHTALASLLDTARCRNGYAVLLDCHSMPSTTVGRKGASSRQSADIILGDRGGLSCNQQLTTFMRTQFEHLGLSVAVNDPYAGGFTTERYGRPAEGCHVLQIEIDRSLYMDELTLVRRPGFERIRQALSLAFANLAAALAMLDLTTGTRLAAE